MKKSMPEIKPKIETFARIKVVGIGGGGTNAIDRMIQMGIRGVEFVSINTDAQALHNNNADKKIHIGKTITRGLGSGMNPDLGRQAAEESQEEIEEVIGNADMIFITGGLGGGTGTGAMPVVAEFAKNRGILTIAVVTRPFSFEGSKRKEVADIGYENIKGKVDAIIAIHNDRILQIIDKRTPMLEAFAKVDEILRQGISGISDLITMNGVVNADFADVKSIMHDAGTALMGIGRASGENRAEEAAKQAITSPLLDLNVDGAKGILFNITASKDLAMFEIDQAAKIITKNIDPDAKVKFGAVVEEDLLDEMRITVIATGFDDSIKKSRTPGFPPMNQTREAQSSTVSDVSPRPMKPVTPAPLQEPMTRPAPEPRSPQFTQQKTEPTMEMPSPGIMDDDEDQLDIPAFIRNKLK